MKNQFILTLLFISSFLSAQNIIGSWEGKLNVFNNELPLIIHIKKENNTYTSTFDSPKQGAKDIAFDVTQFENGKLHLEASSYSMLYDGVLEDNIIKGTFQQNGMSFPLDLEPLENDYTLNRPQTPQPPFDYHTEEVLFKNNKEGNQLAGTLVEPKNAKGKNFPMVIMITGSGAQDRNETIFEHQPFLVIADYLAQHGIGSLRLDDRGIGLSEKGKTEATTADFATDISSAVDFLNDKGYTNIGLLGHSEGGIIAPMVALNNKKVKFQILMAAPGIKIKDLMLLQNKEVMKAYGVSESQIIVMNQQNNKVYDYLISYKGKNLKSDFSKWLKNNKDIFLIEDQINVLTNPWMVYFIRIHPEEYFSQIQIPTLALNGSLDLQVTSKENLAGIEKSLQKAGNKNYKIIELEGLNHLFQTAKTGNPNEYVEIEETISPKFLETIVEWIEKL